MNKIRKIGNVAMVGLIFWLVAFALDSMRAFDDTDDQVNKERSGLGLYTDHLTGCQYIKAGYFGGTTPRLAVDGSQICGN